MILVFILMLLIRIAAYSLKAIFAWFIRCATSVLHCPVCSTVAPMYLYCLTCVSRCPFTFTSHCFSGVFSTIIFFVLLAFIAIRYCPQVASSLSIIMLKPLLTLCQYDCVICISDVCDILSIDVYSSSILQCFSYQVLHVNVEQTQCQYATLSNATLCCNFFRCFIFIAHCDFLLEVKTFDYVYFFVWYSGFDRNSKSMSCLTSLKCLGVINETNVQCFFLYFQTSFHHYSQLTYHYSYRSYNSSYIG